MTPDSGTLRRLDAISDRRLALCAACVGFVLVLPSFGNGLQILDDVPQRDFILAKLHGDVWARNRPWYDVYNLVGGDPKFALLTRFFWVTPWWTWLELKIQFFRPVSAATLYLDYALFGQHYWLAHLHSALWYFAACGLVCLAMLQVSQSRAAAALGSLLFAVDDAHSSSVSWLAGRNAVVGAACFAAALNLYVLGARRQQLRWVVAAAFSLLIGLLAAENVVSTLPFFVAYTFVLDRRRLQRKLVDAALVSACVAIWFVGHKSLGFGTFGSGAYLDPIRDGSAFWRAMPSRILALIQLQLGPPWAIVPYIPFPSFIGLYELGRWVVLPALALFVIRCFDREIAYWSLSATCGLIPLTAGAPHDRLLTHVGMAWCMLLALMILALLRKAPHLSRVPGTGFRLFAAVVLGLHLALAPCALALGVNSQTIPDLDARALDKEPEWWKRDVIVVNVPTMFLVAQLNWQRELRKLQRPSAFGVLGASDQQVEVVRIDQHTIELFAAAGYLQDVFSNFWRGPGVPLRVGELVGVRGFAVTVLQLTPDGRPQRVRVRFDRDLTDPALFFIYWDAQQFKPFRFGQVGERTLIRPVFETEVVRSEAVTAP
ncbi:MAG TPA: hypothetical protein VFG30_12015 [Polyangiales bacterium]|nr:hypothetical protein [Polyangiales bacterium]